MLPERFTIEDDFPPVSYEQWRALVEADLQGVTIEQKLVWHTYDGVDIQPVYTRRDELSGGQVLGLPGIAAVCARLMHRWRPFKPVGTCGKSRLILICCHEPSDSGRS